MAKLKKEEIVALMHEWEYEFGEDCIEYVGYGYGESFSKWLISVGYTFTGSICTETIEELSDTINAYSDIIYAFTNDLEDEALENTLRWEALPEYLANHASDDEYINAVLHFAQRHCDYDDDHEFIRVYFEKRIGKALRDF